MSGGLGAANGNQPGNSESSTFGVGGGGGNTPKAGGSGHDLSPSHSISSGSHNFKRKFTFANVAATAGVGGYRLEEGLLATYAYGRSGRPKYGFHC